MDQLNLLGHLIDRGAPHEPRQMPIRVRNIPPIEQVEAGAAIECLAETRRWPPDLGDSVAEQLLWRVRCALMVCEVRRAEGAPSPHESWKEVMSWLLLDCWEFARETWADCESRADR